MRKSIITYIIYGIIGLAALGLVMQLFTNTASFLGSLMLSIIIGLVIIGLLYYFVLGKRRTNTSDIRKYKQAVRQSKSKYGQTRNTTPVKSQPTPLLKKKGKKRPNHLRVIDGNKSKNKKRASN